MEMKDMKRKMAQAQGLSWFSDTMFDINSYHGELRKQLPECKIFLVSVLQIFLIVIIFVARIMFTRKINDQNVTIISNYTHPIVRIEQGFSFKF